MIGVAPLLKDLRALSLSYKMGSTNQRNYTQNKWILQICNSILQNRMQKQVNSVEKTK
jgi:hypothetical protein